MNRKTPNRLIHEKSPYLLQHAYNPVDWYAWAPETFEKAKAQDKPIFLSIGYSTCHWCHVMEKESFEDVEVATLLNDTFVCIKVDREERPDIDGIYMTVCQMMAGSGGWPLTIMMTPDKRPFFAATYIPKESRFGRVGMKELIPRIGALWKTQRGDVLNAASRVTASLHETVQGTPGGDLGLTDLTATYEQLARAFDGRHGGFGNAPKFPAPHNLTFLLRYWRRTGNEQALRMVDQTVSSMRLGGIYDHVGFGFHRYSTDPLWLVPHFEKMLYDQALLAMAYTEAYQATGRKEYEQTAREIFTYVLRDMTASEGCFYSAEDADSEGEEGKFYLWSVEEVEQILDEDEAELFIRVFNCESEGNFREEASGERTGRNVLHLKKSLQEIAVDLNLRVAELEEQVEAARAKLFARRETRVHPHKDDKILSDWNGLMIAALAKGSQAFDEPSLTEAAKQAADFILGQMWDSGGQLYHRYRDGEAAIAAFLDDYAFMTWGLIELYEATFDELYLQAAIDLNDSLVHQFWDDRHGGFYFAAESAGELLLRKKEISDGALPSGNSVALLNLLRLARATGETRYERKAVRLVHSFSGTVSGLHQAHTQFMVALDFAVGPSHEVVVVGDKGSEDTEALLESIRKVFAPNKVVLFKPADEESPEVVKLASFTDHLAPVEKKATAYVCQNYRCELPRTDPIEVGDLLTR